MCVRGTHGGRKYFVRKKTETLKQDNRAFCRDKFPAQARRARGTLREHKVELD